DAARGQYAAGSELGAAVKAYRAEDHVSPQSNTLTYAALKLTIDNPRWAGVPFYLRTGKRLAERRTEVAIHFKKPASALLPAEPNLIRLQMDPIEGTATSFAVKLPGPKMRLATATSLFRYADLFPRQPTVGYEGLLYGCMTGDATLFQRADMIEGSWAAVQPLLDAWAEGSPESYAAGSAGPAGADALLARDGRAWLPLGTG
ncbi:MAG: glucose-6-phosphate dehydrogenase, partial [Mesorhizobium sp.]